MTILRRTDEAYNTSSCSVSDSDDSGVNQECERFFTSSSMIHRRENQFTEGEMKKHVFDGKYRELDLLKFTNNIITI